MRNRNHTFNSSSRSVASVISQLSGAMNINGSSIRNNSQNLKLSWSGRPPLRVLYDLLIAPMEDALPKRDGLRSVLPDLVLVLEGGYFMDLLQGSNFEGHHYQGQWVRASEATPNQGHRGNSLHDFGGI